MVQDISSSDAWAALEADPQAQLIDVRTVAEWNFVGIPDLLALERQTILIEYQSFQSPMPNDQFVPSMAKADLNPKQTLLFICRTGGRSRAAAQIAEAAGYAKCFNVADGFEGALDENNHRGNRNGWKAANLPWRQG